MKLSLIFFLVLGLSVILGCIASLGTTYATSYSRLTSMAQEFTGVAQDAVDRFGGLVRDLVADSSGVVAHIIGAEFNASSWRIVQTEGRVTNITLDLLAYTRVASNRSRTDVQGLVSSFGGFMQDVIDEFGNLATSYSVRLSMELAAKAQTAFSSLMHDRALAIRRAGELYQLGVLNLTRTPDAPLTPSDCLLLAALCDHSADMSVPTWLAVGTYTGGHYTCNGDLRAWLLATRDVNGNKVQGQLYWDAYPNSTPAAQRKTWQQRCLTEPPVWQPIGAGTVCPRPDRCTCGFDVRCRNWYRPLMGTSGPAEVRMSEPYLDYFRNLPMVALYFPIYDPTYQVNRNPGPWKWPSSPLVAASSSDFSFASMDAFLAGLLTANSTYLVVALNDTLLTKVGDAHGRATPADTDPCSEWYLPQSCRPELLSLGQWQLRRRSSLPASHMVYMAPLLWVIFPSSVGLLTYFTLVGMNATLLSMPTQSLKGKATASLGALWTQQLAAMAAADADLQAHLSSVEAANLESLRAMRVAMAQDVALLAQSSQEVLDASLASSTAKLAELLAAQTAEVREQQAKHLAALASQMGWTVAIVLGILAGILAVSLYGTFTITRSLGAIIRSMEEAATMNLEAVADPRPSWVTEVRRIQVALHALLLRLARYKSFMPAALFEHSSPTAEGPDSVPDPALSLAGPPAAPKAPGSSQRRGDRELHLDVIVASPQLLDATLLTTPAPPPQVTRRTVVALAVNVLGFKAHLFHATEGFFETLMNAYLTVVHSTVVKYRGNLDLVLGDQLLVTFNAHVRCSDALNVAAATAAELRAVLAEVRAPAALCVQMGLAAGKAFVGRVGYDAFRTMLTVGTPIKLATMLAHLSGFPEYTVLADPTVEEHAKFHFDMPPADLIHLPLLGCFAPRLARGMPVYALGARKATAAQEWLYQVETACLPSGWDAVFQRVLEAGGRRSAEEVLTEFLERFPDHIYARRLLRRLPNWQPGRGVLLYETADPVAGLAISHLTDVLIPHSSSL